MITRERTAWVQLGCALATLLLFGLLSPRIGVAKAQAVFGLLSIAACVPLMQGAWRFGRERADERDLQIQAKAMQFAFCALWPFSVIAIWSVISAYGGHGVISVSLLPLWLWLNWAMFIVLQSGATLVLYRKS